MLKLVRRKETRFSYSLLFGNLKVGECIMAEDGFFHWGSSSANGLLSSWELKEIARHLDELNKPYEKKLEKYFKRKSKKTR